MGKKVKCTQCGEGATVFVSLVMDGTVTKVAYCRVHAEDKGVFASGAYDFLAFAEGEESGKITIPVLRAEDLRCPACKLSQTEFERSGRFGCAVCYHTFGAALKHVLGRMHVGEHHKGKIPKRAQAQHRMRDQIRNLENKIEEAVADERYEEAAACRDKISEINRETQGDSPAKP